jgi:hypothetical protein
LKIFGLAVIAASGHPTEIKPANAIARIPTAMIKLRMAWGGGYAGSLESTDP